MPPAERPGPIPGPLPDVQHGRLTALHAIDAVRARFPGAVGEHVSFRDEETIVVEPGRLVEICRFLKQDPDLSYIMLIDITATHWPERDHEYEVAYLLRSLRHNSLLRLKVRLGGAGAPAALPTVSGVWATADWLEREEWDKVGVVFEGHPDLRRILLPEDWEGHPLRKDYPVEGIGA